MIRIKQLREELGISQLDFAKKIHLTQQSISLYENGSREPSLEVLTSIADFFNVSTDYLLGKSDIKNSEELKKVPFANAGGLDIKGLDNEDLLELQRQIDYIKKMKNKNEK